MIATAHGRLALATRLTCQALDRVIVLDRKAVKLTTRPWLAEFGPRLPLMSVCLGAEHDGRITPEQLACYGPQTTTLREGMMMVHTAWQSLMTVVNLIKKGTMDVVNVIAALGELAATALKVASDCHAICARAQALAASAGNDD